MAKKKASRKSGVNKSQAIKDYLASHPNAAPKVVAEDLKAQGIDVTAGYVSTIKTQQKSKSKTKTGRRGKAASKDTSPVEDVTQAANLMYQAVDLVMKAGFKEAKSMVEVAGKMVDRIRDK